MVNRLEQEVGTGAHPRRLTTMCNPNQGSTTGGFPEMIVEMESV